MNRAQYEKEHWEEIAKSDDYMKHISDKTVTVQKCINAIKPHLKKGNILEVGCGIGRITKPLSKEMKTSFFVGTDISFSMLAKANGQLKNLIWLEADARKLEERIRFLSKEIKKRIKFDSVYSMTMIHQRS